MDISELKKEISRYVVTGVSAVALNLLVLYSLTDGLDFWYMTSVFLAFLVAFAYSFVMHKYWTFKNEDKVFIVEQMFFYLILSLFNLLFNIVAMYFLVDIIDLWYMASQIIILGFLALVNFSISKFLIFKK